MPPALKGSPGVPVLLCVILLTYFAIFTYFPTVVLLLAVHSRNVHFRSAWVFFKGLHFLHSQN